MQLLLSLPSRPGAFLVLLLFLMQILLPVTASTEDFASEPIQFFSDPHLYNCQLFNITGRLVCDILSTNVKQAIYRLPPETQFAGNISLIINTFLQPPFIFPIEPLAQRATPLVSLFVHSRRPFSVANCSLTQLARSLVYLGLYGIQDISDPFCGSASRLEVLKLYASTHACLSSRWVIQSARDTLKELYFEQSPLCSLSDFQLEGFPLLESVTLSAPLIINIGQIRISRFANRNTVDSLAEMRFTNLPRLRTLLFMLHSKTVKCDGHIFGPNAMVNLTSLETFHVASLLLDQPSKMDPCNLLAPGAFRAGSTTMRDVSIGSGFMGLIKIDFDQNRDLLRCENCTRQSLLIGEFVWPSFLPGCFIQWPANFTLNMTHLRVLKCGIPEISVRELRNWPRLESLIAESGVAEQGSDGSRSTRQQQYRLHLGDLVEYIGANGNLQEITIFNADCVCPMSSSEASLNLLDSGAVQVSIFCQNLKPDAFKSVSGALKVCFARNEYPKVIAKFLVSFGRQCIKVSENEVSCSIGEHFNQSEPIPSLLTIFHCQLNSTVVNLTRAFLSKAGDLKILAISAFHEMSWMNPEGLEGIEDGAFEAAQSLEVLNLRNNRLTHINQRTFAGLNRLRFLDLFNNRHLKSIDPRSFLPLGRSLQKLRLSVLKPDDLPTLLSGAGLLQLELAHIELVGSPGVIFVEKLDLLQGSFANFPNMRELTISFDDLSYVQLNQMILKTGCVSNLPRLRSLTINSNEFWDYSLVLEEDAFTNLSGRIEYLSLSSVRYPAPESNWLQLLAGPKVQGATKEVIVEFKSDKSEKVGLQLIDFLNGNVSFNVDFLTLSTAGIQHSLLGVDLEHLGRLFPQLQRLSLLSCLSVKTSQLSRFASVSKHLTELHATSETCDSEMLKAGKNKIDLKILNDGNKSGLIATLSCPHDATMCMSGSQLSINSVSTALLLAMALLTFL